MRQIPKLLVNLITLLFLIGPLLAANKPADPAAKAEAEYQKFIKEHLGYKLLLTEYDKFKKLTVFRVDPRMSNELEFKKPDGGGINIDMMVRGVVPDKLKADNPAFVILTITAAGKSDESWRYIDCKDLNWLVDDAALEWESIEYDNHVFDDASTNEYFSIVLNPSQFAKLAKAGKIEVKVCNDEFVFVQKQLWVLRWVSEQVQATLAARTAK
jgi:hypothetical protein